LIGIEKAWILFYIILEKGGNIGDAADIAAFLREIGSQNEE
jgi:hypothetical protein